MLSLNVAIILMLMALAFAFILRAAIWLAQNLEIITSRRQITIFKLAGVGFVMLFFCPAIVILVINVLQYLQLLTVSGG